MTGGVDGGGRGAFRVRAARPEDLGALERLLGDFAEGSGTPRRPVHPGTRAALASRWDGDLVVFLAETSAGEPFGFASAWFALDLGDGPGAWLSDLYVAADRRRLGAGRALVAAVGDWARTRGAVWLVWHTGREDGRARAFYEAIGARALPHQLVMSLAL